MLPARAKIIERHVHSYLFDYLNAHDLIYKNLSCFRKQHSTKTTLAYTVDILLYTPDNDHVKRVCIGYYY